MRPGWQPGFNGAQRQVGALTLRSKRTKAAFVASCEGLEVVVRSADSEDAAQEMLEAEVEMKLTAALAALRAL